MALYVQSKFPHINWVPAPPAYCVPEMFGRMKKFLVEPQTSVKFCCSRGGQYLLFSQSITLLYNDGYFWLWWYIYKQLTKILFCFNENNLHGAGRLWLRHSAATHLPRTIVEYMHYANQREVSLA